MSAAENTKKSRLPAGRKRKLLLVLFNIVLILSALGFLIVFSNHVSAEQKQTKIDAFMSSVESMKQVSANYINSERGYVNNWASYINASGMTMDEALDYIRTANTQSDRQAHIVDMDTFEAHSTVTSAKYGNTVDCYQTMASKPYGTDLIFIENMRNMFEGTADDASILGKYRVYESQMNAVSVGARVTLLTDSGKKDYLLLRVIPVERMKSVWIFPTEYSDAEVGIITKSGSYVIQSASMKNESFISFIRSYNFADDYNGVDAVEEQLMSTDSGLLHFKNSRGEDCTWYYSSFGNGIGLDVLGVIKDSSLTVEGTQWTLVLSISGILFLLMVIDGWYLMSMNRRLRESVAAAEQANLAKTQFLSSMSHDIRTPMNAVLGMTDIARRNLDNPVCVSDCLNKVNIAGNHLLTLINDILDISKVESGRMKLSPSCFSIERAIATVEDMIRPQLHEKRLEFTGTYTDIPHKYIVADELRLNQILINLLTNSVKYTKPGGRVSFTVREEIVPNDDSLTRLVFIVEDNGIGMSQDFQKTMYDSFSRATNSQINKIQGSGLGLAIVRQMVDLMGGAIACDSEPGRGTKFTVAIDVPIAETPDEAEGSSESSSTDISGMKVLVAEDNDLNWEIISTMLEEYGVACERVENGQECVNRMNAVPDGTYDIILMDVQMPVMNGREATRILRQSEREYVRNIPIAAMTADAFAEDVQACIDCGMNGHISKPVNIQKVLDFMNKVKDGKFTSK